MERIRIRILANRGWRKTCLVLLAGHIAALAVGNGEQASFARAMSAESVGRQLQQSPAAGVINAWFTKQARERRLVSRVSMCLGVVRWCFDSAVGKPTQARPFCSLITERSSFISDISRFVARRRQKRADTWRHGYFVLLLTTVSCS